MKLLREQGLSQINKSLMGLFELILRNLSQPLVSGYNWLYVADEILRLLWVMRVIKGTFALCMFMFFYDSYCPREPEPLSYPLVLKVIDRPFLKKILD